jgi:hypothetical protein
LLDSVAVGSNEHSDFVCCIATLLWSDETPHQPSPTPEVPRLQDCAEEGIGIPSTITRKSWLQPNVWSSLHAALSRRLSQYHSWACTLEVFSIAGKATTKQGARKTRLCLPLGRIRVGKVIPSAGIALACGGLLTARFRIDARTCVCVLGDHEAGIPDCCHKRRGVALTGSPFHHRYFGGRPGPCSPTSRWRRRCTLEPLMCSMYCSSCLHTLGGELHRDPFPRPHTSLL